MKPCPKCNNGGIKMALVDHDRGIIKDSTWDGIRYYNASTLYCGIIIFKTLEGVQRSIDLDGVMNGSKLFPCENCGNNYRADEDGYFRYPKNRCTAFKELYAASFDK